MFKVMKSLRSTLFTSGKVFMKLQDPKARVFHDVKKVTLEFPSWFLETVKKHNFNERVYSFSNKWLRDNCQCPECVDTSTRQKLISSGHISSSCTPKKCEITETPKGLGLIVDWERNSIQGYHGQHKSEFPLTWLIKHISSSVSIPNTETTSMAKKQLEEFTPILWNKKSISGVDLFVEYNNLINSQKDYFRFLNLIAKYGFGFIRNVPTNQTSGIGGVELLATKFGPIRETFYGRVFTVKSVPNAKNIAYTSLHLPVHMDLMYFESPPGLQFLHCIENSTIGGESTFVDIFSAIEMLQQMNAKYFSTLCNIRVNFEYDNNNHHLKKTRPTIVAFPQHHNTYESYYAPPFQGVMPHYGYEIMDEFYEAFNTFSTIIDSDRMTFKYRLKKGDCVVFANRRVIHGRLSFEPNTGSRHLKGTYVDWDSFLDAYRVLSKQFK